MTAPSKNTTLITTHQQTDTILLFLYLNSVDNPLFKGYLVFHYRKIQLLQLRMTADKGGSHNKAYARLQTQQDDYLHLLISTDFEPKNNTK